MFELSSWGWLELVLIGVFIYWVTGGPERWIRQPLLLGGAVVLFSVGLHPVLDAVARHSVWLHCLQSALIHHLAPILLLFASYKTPTMCKPSVKEKGGFQLGVVVVFGTMSGVWMLPQLHQRLMDDALLYSLMKWAMAFSGVWLCHVIGNFCLRKNIPLLKQWSFSLAVALPQLFVGGFLLYGPLLYPMPGHSTGMIVGGGVSARFDQVLGGFLLCLSAIIMLLVDRVLHSKPHRKIHRMKSGYFLK